MAARKIDVASGAEEHETHPVRKLSEHQQSKRVFNPCYVAEASAGGHLVA